MPNFLLIHTGPGPLSGPKRAYNYRHVLGSFARLCFPLIKIRRNSALAHPFRSFSLVLAFYAVGFVDVLLRMHKRFCLLLALTVSVHAWEGASAETGLLGGRQTRGGVDVPISSAPGSRLVRREPMANGESGLGNNVDMCVSFSASACHLNRGRQALYDSSRSGQSSVPSTPRYGCSFLAAFFLHCLDTGSSDLWVISDQCRANACAEATSRRYPSSSFNSTQQAIELSYGDSTGSSSARGVIGKDTATVAGLAMAGQPFALVDDTTNPVVRYGVSGLFGMGFPSSRYAADLHYC